MENTYRLKINESHDFELSREMVSGLDMLKTGTDTYHLLYHGKSYHIEFITSGFDQKHYVVKINNSENGVRISNPLDILIDEMGFSSNDDKNIGEIAAPMPGLILDILVQEGQEVTVNDSLLILEAMKMENMITSPRNGIIKSIKVKKGAAVEKKHVLVEFE
ncbi:MAG: acetyl-CoA carboxylase biotin carboxyl carrier protein subunit [Bacteroidota bacterium]